MMGRNDWESVSSYAEVAVTRSVNAPPSKASLQFTSQEMTLVTSTQTRTKEQGVDVSDQTNRGRFAPKDSSQESEFDSKQ